MHHHLLAGASLLLLATLCGCFAELDWRELRSTQGGFSVLLPARPTEASRPLATAGNAVMHQWSSRAADSVWAVAYLDTPADASAPPSHAIAELRDALLANIGAHPLKQRDITVQDATGIETIARGHSAGVEVELHLRIVMRGHRLYQLAVLMPPSHALETGVQTFFESFRLLATPPESATRPLNPARAA